ncbi:MAG: UDP-2,3-diacylglucosamine diphosphatase LpxI [Kiritimatiellae bacterium]|nr:UDP-2,3-diacylglucosamine diphosphatase LpxI [Kiritimatiellia bacterium]
MKKLLVIAGSGVYPELLVTNAKKAGVAKVDVLAVKGSTSRRVRSLADAVIEFGLGEIATAVSWASKAGYEGAILAGQISPLSLFRTRFDKETIKWLSELNAKNAHSLFGKLVEKFEEAGLKILPASLYMQDSLPGEGCIAKRDFSEQELKDVIHASKVVEDMGRHDVGQTVVVKDGMVLAVEAFEGTNAAIKRAGKLDGRGGVVFKAARVGHDMRFDIPVVGLKTLKVMKRAGITALAFHANRLVMLDKEKVMEFANRHSIAIVGIKTDLPAAPTEP